MNWHHSLELANSNNQDMNGGLIELAWIDLINMQRYLISI